MKKKERGRLLRDRFAAIGGWQQWRLPNPRRKRADRSLTDPRPPKWSVNSFGAMAGGGRLKQWLKIPDHVLKESLTAQLPSGAKIAADIEEKWLRLKKLKAQPAPVAAPRSFRAPGPA